MRAGQQSVSASPGIISYVLISYCIVNTNGREHLLRCLDSIANTLPDGISYEVLVVDNASTDGSVEAVGDRNVGLLALGERHGKAENDSTLLKAAQGQYCLLLNEDTELCEGAVAALHNALDEHPQAGAAACQLLDPEGSLQPCAWRLPGVATAAAFALSLHGAFTVQSKGQLVRRVGWAQSAAMLVRREAAEAVGFLDPAFFVYSDETDFCKRLGDAGWQTLYVPGARAIHHEQLASGGAAAGRRIVEFHRNRDLYMRKHHRRWQAIGVRVLTASGYLLRAIGASFMGAHSAKRYLFHARQALFPARGEGIREHAQRYNSSLYSC
jgi:N-acetylglucosaminyl-diphospho-decaprenol L-rhamnosyltransferase